MWTSGSLLRITSDIGLQTKKAFILAPVRPSAAIALACFQP
jgi:hypothetical protein